MPECVGNYTIPTANGKVEGADMLAGAGTYNRPLLMLLIVLLIILGLGVEFPQLYINDSYPNCQFVGLTDTADGIVCYCVLKETSLKIALTVYLPSWRTGLKQVKI